MISGGRNIFLAGLLSGAAFFSEYLTAIIFFIWFLQLWHSRSFKAAIYYGCGILPFVLAFLCHNFVLTGNALTTAYDYQVHYDFKNAGFSIPNARAMIDMIVSPQKGLIFYIPVFIAFLPLMAELKKRDFHGILKNQAALPCLVYFFVLSAFIEWRGGWTFGTRYLMPAIGIFIYTYLPLLRYEGLKRAWIWLPAGLGMIHALSAKISVQYSIPSDYQFPFTEYIWSKILEGSFNDGGVLTKVFGLDPQMNALLFLSMISLMLTGFILSGNKIIGQGRSY